MIWDVTHNRIKLWPNTISKCEHRADANEFDGAPTKAIKPVCDAYLVVKGWIVSRSVTTASIGMS